MAKTLNRKQSRFVLEYLKDLNATQAAIRSGYSKKTARAIGTENLSKPAIQAAIKSKTEQKSEKLEISVDWVVRELVALKETAKNESVKLGAIEFLGKWQGMLKDKGDRAQVVILGADAFDKPEQSGVSG